ncbi:MAG: KEOPS complex subunit Cgi121 [Candidatus Methanomethylophilaceae archaeon]
MHLQVIGMHGNATFEQMVGHFTSMRGDCVLVDPDMVVGKDHLLSAAEHAERAFREGTNRSKTVLTEIILYSAWERQIGKAMAKMKPKEGRDDYVSLLIDIDDPRLEEIGMVRDDSLFEATPEKAERLGLIAGSLSFEDQAVENVAMVELLKA